MSQVDELRSTAMDPCHHTMMGPGPRESATPAGMGWPQSQMLAPHSSDRFNQLLAALIEEHEREVGEVRGMNGQSPSKSNSRQIPNSADSAEPEEPARRQIQPPSENSPPQPGVPDLPNALAPIMDIEDSSRLASPTSKQHSDDVDSSTPGGNNRGSAFTVTKIPTLIDGGIHDEVIVKKVVQKMTNRETGGGKTGGEKIVASLYFSISSATIILLNTIYIGFQADVMVRIQFERVAGNPNDKWDTFFFIFDIIFCILFSVELIARLFFLGLDLFSRGPDKYWHFFDSVIVVTSAFELIAEAAGQSMGSGLSVLRSVRLVRILRLVRLASSIDVIKAMVRSMQTMIYALGGVISSFVPALIVLCIIIYICDLFILEAVRSYLKADVGLLVQAEQDVQANVVILQSFYGGMFTAFFTLLASVTGGYDWTDCSNPLKEIHFTYEIFFQMYVIFTMLGVLNVIAGLFVNVATTATALEHDMVIDESIKQEQKFTMKIVELLNSGDSDGDGLLTMEELHEYVTDERVKAYFNTLNLDVLCLGKVFKLLDTEQTGEIDVMKFATACIQWRGLATNIDLVIINNSIERLDQKLLFVIDKLCKDPKRFGGPLLR